MEELLLNEPSKNGLYLVDMKQVEEITRLNKFIVIKFIEDTINDFNTYDWYFYEELSKKNYHRVNCLSFMYDYIDYNYIIGNLELYLVEGYKKKLRLFSKTPTDAFRGFRTGGEPPLYLQTEDRFFKIETN